MRPKNPTRNIEMEVAMLRSGLGTMRLSAVTGLSISMISMVKKGWRYPSRKQATLIEKVLKKKSLFDHFRDE